MANKILNMSYPVTLNQRWQVFSSARVLFPYWEGLGDTTPVCLWATIKVRKATGGSAAVGSGVDLVELFQDSSYCVLHIG